MKVVCKSNSAKNLDLNEVKIIFTNQTSFDITREKEYIVMGLLIHRDSSSVYYLIDEFDKPRWLPHQLFEISDPELSAPWYISILDKHKFPGNIHCLSGFYELCNNENYHDDLMERERYALDIYHQRKYEVQEWYFQKG